jgi:hypothetical protein
MHDTGFRVALAALGGAAGELAAIPHASSAERLSDAAGTVRSALVSLGARRHRFAADEGVTAMALLYGALEVANSATVGARLSANPAERERRLRHLLRAATDLAAAARQLARLTPTPRVPAAG